MALKLGVFSGILKLKLFYMEQIYTVIYTQS